MTNRSERRAKARVIKGGKPDRVEIGSKAFCDRAFRRAGRPLT